MTREENIEISLQHKFKSEQLKRVIDKCNDIDTLRQIAFELLAINQQKTAIVSWSTKKALKADLSKLRDQTID
tara:strand:- start:426 stop:644 length:219 start_codon:yes stop_codon:yes gene_type:complete